MNVDGQQPHILCVNNSPDILALQKAILEEEGFRVTTHSRLEKDLDAIVELAPDVIIVDYMWRQSDAEWVFLNLVMMDRRTRKIPLILCTGAVREAREMEEHLATLGIRVVLKPFDVDHLISVVQEVLVKRDPREQSVISTLE